MERRNYVEESLNQREDLKDAMAPEKRINPEAGLGMCLRNDLNERYKIGRCALEGVRWSGRTVDIEIWKDRKVCNEESGTECSEAPEQRP